MQSEREASIYNPNQDEREIAEIRRKYSKLLDEVHRNKADLITVESERLNQLVEKANSVQEQIRTTSEACLDSRFFAESARLGAEKVERLPLSVSDFSTKSYLSILEQFLSNNSFNDLGRLVGHYWTGVETPDYMLGPLEVQVVQRAPRQAAKKFEPSGPAVTPTVVKDLMNPDGSSTVAASSNLLAVYSILCECGSVPFYHFITDPQSFSKTVENMFYVSFLIKEGKVRMFFPTIGGQSDIMYIEAVDEAEEEEDEAVSAAEPCQAVLGITEGIWRKNVEKFQITQAIISL